MGEGAGGPLRLLGSLPGDARMSRRVWLDGLLVYAAAAAADVGVHLTADRRAGENWLSPDNLAVAVAAGLFWPVDLVAQRLLGR